MKLWLNSALAWTPIYVPICGFPSPVFPKWICLVSSFLFWTVADPTPNFDWKVCAALIGCSTPTFSLLMLLKASLPWWGLRRWRAYLLYPDSLKLKCSLRNLVQHASEPHCPKTTNPLLHPKYCKDAANRKLLTWCITSKIHLHVISPSEPYQEHDMPLTILAGIPQV